MPFTFHVVILSAMVAVDVNAELDDRIGRGRSASSRSQTKCPSQHAVCDVAQGLAISHRAYRMEVLDE